MEYPTILSMSTWLSLRTETKQALRDMFNIPRSGFVEVVDGRVHSDGTSLVDLMSLTVDKMQEYAKSKETDFSVLFNQIVKGIENPVTEATLKHLENFDIEEPTIIKPKTIKPNANEKTNK